MRKAAVGILASTTLATSFLLGTTGTASADPWTPAAADIVGVGTPTTGPLLNQVSAEYNAALAAAGDTTSPRMYSWDASGSAQIVPKDGATAIYRPANTWAGITALNVNTAATVDFARADRGPGYTSDLPSNLFVAFAKDAVSWAAKAGGHAPSNLTTADLRAIYSCVKTNWQQIDPALPSATIKATLPGVGSGTRDHFLTAIGGVIPGLCVTSGGLENQGTDPALNDPDVVIPYAVGRYVGQTLLGQSTSTDAPGELTVRGIDGITPVDTVNKTINAPFAVTGYGRILYTVVRDADWLGTGPRTSALRAVFAKGGLLCGPGGTTIIRQHGFLPLPVNGCGTVMHG
ncbi:hypothetical protein GCM10009639_22340 [Kitasatospora putterlickiae]|uniref:PBP domain-containing protein n=1 Tax=Kitasatospora putterlickiae TaxID=221725 RepID=A0ABN1XWD3_9ACTN